MYLRLRYFRMLAMRRNLAWHPAGQELVKRHWPRDPVGKARGKRKVRVSFSDSRLRALLQKAKKQNKM